MLGAASSPTFRRMLTKILRRTALLASLFIALPGCPESDRSTHGAKSNAGAETVDKSAVPSSWPREPVDLGAAPITGDTSLPVEVTLEGLDGGAPSLGELLSGNSLVVYVSPDTDDRQNRAGSRMLRDVAKAGGPVGFRQVVIFTEGTSSSAVDDWFRKRQVKRIGRAAIDSEGQFAARSGWAPRSAALVGPDGQIGAMFGPTEDWDSRLGFDGGLNADLLFAAWEAKETPPELDGAIKQAAVDLVQAVLAAEPGAAIEPSAPGLDLALVAPVYVSLYRIGMVRRLRGESNAPTLGAAVVEATLSALESAGDTASAWRASATDTKTLRFAIDVASKPTPIPTKDIRSLWYLVEPGIDGIVVTKGGQSGVVLPHEAVTQGFLTPRVRSRSKKWEATIKEGCRRANVGVGEWTSDAVSIARFRTASFGVNLPGGTTFVDMVRGNVLIDGPPDEAAILESLRLGGLWLVNTVQEDGRFDYEYFPNQDKGSEGYNIVRHAGSVYGLFEMYELARNEPALSADQERYIQAGARSIGYIYDATESPKGDTTGNRRCLIDRGRCESGSVALALLTFLKRPRMDNIPPEYRAQIYRDGDDVLMEGLGLTLLDMIDERGAVFATYGEAMAMEMVKKEPVYYPGESMLALLLFYEQTKDKRWLKGAQAIGDRQAGIYKKKRMTWPDHWIMQAFTPLWRATQNDFYAQTAYTMATHSVTEQYPTVWTPFADYHGAWRREKDVPRTTRAGSRLEAIRGVVHLAWEAGVDATVWEDSLIAATDHLIEKQYRADNVWYLPDPERVQGAYPMGIVDNHVRIDNNQHAVVGMVGALETLRRRAKEQ